MSATSARTGGLDRRTSLASWHSPLAAAEGSLGIAVEEKDEPYDGPQMRTLGGNRCTGGWTKPAQAWRRSGLVRKQAAGGHLRNTASG